MSTAGEHYLKEELYELVRRDPAIFEFLQAGSLDGIWYWDIENPGEEWMSPRFKDLFGYTEEEIPNTPDWWQANIFEEDLKVALDNFAKHISDPDHPYDQVVRYRHKDGSTVWVRCRGMAIRDEQGKPLRLLGAHTDITALMRTEDALRRAKEVAEKANRAKAEFLANVSHEIRTPLNGIIGMTELLLNMPLDRQQREYLGVIMTSADGLLYLLNDILDLSKIEAGRLEMAAVDFALRDSVAGTLQSFSIQAAEKGIELTCRVAPQVPRWVVGDPNRLRQIVVNLVGNAVKFTDGGEVSLNVVLVSQEDDRLRLQFDIRDTGPGISQEEQAKIFHAFTQADTSMSRRFGGTGLGLAISRQLADMMGGEIWVDSEVGVGSTFHFTVDLHRSKEVSEVARSTESLDGLGVLIVDDNETNRTILQEMIATWRMRPVAVDSGEIALKALAEASAKGRPYRLLLIDAMMPGMDGLTLAERVREDEALAGLPIVMMSSAGHLDGRAARAGITRSLTKPVKQSALLDVLLDILHPEKGDRTAAFAAPKSFSSLPQLRVLLAEDGLINQRVAMGLLEGGGHKITIANDGREAVAAVSSAGPEEFDLVLMDLQMPVMDGFEATRKIRELDVLRGTHLPIIAMTAHAMQRDRERCLEAGMDEYVSKPIRAIELLRTIESVVAPGRFTQSQSSDIVDAPPSSDGAINLGVLLDATDGKKRLATNLIERFSEEGPRLVERIREAIAGRDAEELLLAAHTLKSSVRLFGAHTAADLALSLEMSGREGAFDGAADVLVRLEAAIDQVARALGENPNLEG